MKSNSYDKYYGITTFGESHGKAIGVVIQDIKPGIEFPFERIQNALNERKPGTGTFSSPRKEKDELQILSGVFEGKTTGMPICLLVYNKDARNKDYEHLKDLFRPGHADFSYFKKFKIYDHRGGGRASGRETISRVAASGLVENILEDIKIITYPIKIGKFETTQTDLSFQNELSWHDRTNYENLIEYLNNIKNEGNSIGGIVEVKILGLPAGLGDPVFEKLDANLAKAILSIGAVKGIEFGTGFEFAALKGNKANDQMNNDGFITNHNGGILGGISTGNDLIFRFVVKPTPSINITQKTVTKDNIEVEFKSYGRHDTCIIPRIIPVAEAMVKLVLADALSFQKLISNDKLELADYREAIDKIDEDILIALGRRRKISELIGIFKQENKLQIENKGREEELLNKLRQKAKLWNIDDSLVTNLWDIIISESKKRQ
ncbi:MAG: chorismate synthase [Candidatus Cloacimonadota bacterium]|nr:chorismate synthase [Candidatus Cloacimonadota bacterium]